MDTVVHLEKRHGTQLHVKVANEFFAVVLGLFLLYSILEAVNVKYRAVSKVLRFVKRPFVLTIIWLVLCCWAIFHHFHHDILQIARRYGQLAIASSTLSVFLAFKPALFPYTHQVNLVSIHKWIGRSAILCAFVHGVIYTISYATRKPAEATEPADHHDKRHAGHVHKLFSLYNVFGMISLLSFLVIFATSLGSVRRRAYSLFYALHRPLVIVIYVLMIWHARPSSWLLVPLALLIIIVQIGVRLLLHKTVHITKVQHFGPSLALVTFNPPVPQSLVRGSASHVRLTTSFTSPLTFFRSSHPYTLVGSSNLIVRETRFKIVEGNTYSLFGPFSASFDPQPYTHLLVFAGGSGVSLLPSLNNIIKNQKFIWITRRPQEVAVLSEFGVNNCEVYISNFSRREGKHKGVSAEDYELQEFEIESDEEESLTTSAGSESSDPSVDSSTKFPRHSGRPDFNSVADSFFTSEDQAAGGSICVVSCGPQSLVDEVTKWAALRNYDTWSEVFAL